MEDCAAGFAFLVGMFVGMVLTLLGLLTLGASGADPDRWK